MSRQRVLSQSAIFPHGKAALRALGLTMVLMSFLAALALAGLLASHRAANAWSNSLANEATIIVRPLEGQDIEAEVAKAAALAKATTGILSTKILDAAAAAVLLEPWLGKDVAKGLPLPRLISLQLNGNLGADFTSLEEALAAQVKGASLDAHERWQQEFSRMGRALVVLALGVLGLIGATSGMLVSFAALNVMETNGAAVEVLQMVGAEPRFIARAIDRQFMQASLLASCLGVCLALGTLYGLGLLMPVQELGLGNAASQLLFGAEYLWRSLSYMVLIPICATLLALWSARITLLKALAKAP